MKIDFNALKVTFFLNKNAQYTMTLETNDQYYLVLQAYLNGEAQYKIL